MGMLELALDPATVAVAVAVAVDPGTVMNRFWVSNGAGLLEEPVSSAVASTDTAPKPSRTITVSAASSSCSREG